MSLGNNGPACRRGRRRRNPGNNTLVLVGVLGVGYYVWSKGLLKLPDTTPPGGASEDACALAVSQHRPDLCALIPGWNPSYSCATQAGTIATVKHWWSVLNPPEKAQYGTLCAYAHAMGWA